MDQGERQSFIVIKKRKKEMINIIFFVPLHANNPRYNDFETPSKPFPSVQFYIWPVSGTIPECLRSILSTSYIFFHGTKAVGGKLGSFLGREVSKWKSFTAWDRWRIEKSSELSRDADSVTLRYSLKTKKMRRRINGNAE